MMRTLLLEMIRADVLMPRGIVWPGLLLNTAAFGGAAWLMTGGIARLRRSGGT
jgi:hypothetical protein